MALWGNEMMLWSDVRAVEVQISLTAVLQYCNGVTARTDAYNGTVKPPVFCTFSALFGRRRCIPSTLVISCRSRSNGASNEQACRVPSTGSCFVRSAWYGL